MQLSDESVSSIMAPYMNPSFSGGDTDSSSGHLSPNSFPGNDIGSDIAIIGLSFQFPEADTEESLWELMNSGRSAATEFPPDRLSSVKYFDVEDARTGTVGVVGICLLLCINTV